MKQFKKIILTLVHLSIFVTTVVLTIRGVFFGAAAGQLGENMISYGFFRAFTVDSNDFTAIASLIMAINLIISLFKKEYEIPYWAILLQYISGVAVGLTFITTAVFLAPSQVALGNSYWLYFSQDMFFLHFTTPLCTILAYIFGPSKINFHIKENFMGLIPLSIYAIVYILNAIILKTWIDFYGFTFGGQYWTILPVLCVIYLVTYSIGKLMIIFRRQAIRIIY